MDLETAFRVFMLFSAVCAIGVMTEDDGHAGWRLYRAFVATVFLSVGVLWQ